MMRETPVEGYLLTGIRELDKRLGLGIPVGTLGLIEGESDVGKSVFCQHFAFGTLSTTDNAVAYYTTEYDALGLVSQMNSLGLPAQDHFLLDRLRIYQTSLSAYYGDTCKPFWALTSHLSKLPEQFKLVIVDSITDLVTHSNPATTLEFFSVCRELCAQGRSIFIVAHSLTFDRETFSRASELCDAYLKLSYIDHNIFGLVNVLEMLKAQWATQYTVGKFLFEIEPKTGIKTIPLAEMKV
ncbi:ATPase domain-containing protein [Bacteroidota bacterium]